MILQNNYTEYEDALAQLDLDKLSDRREQLCLSFALKCVRNPKTQDMFPLNKKSNKMKFSDK